MILLKLCWTLIMINALTIGGGFAMLPLLHKEFVEKNQWLTNHEFVDAIAIGQLTPGPLTVMNAVIGYKIHGLSGAILAMISAYLPPIIIVSLVTKYYYTYKKSVIVDSSFKGIKAAVIGLLAGVAVSLGNSSLIDITTFGIAILSFAVVTFTKASPSIVIIGAGVLGALFL